MTDVPRGRHFEEFRVGETFTTAARTVTEGALDRFAGLSGDFNPLHTDEASARQGPMKGRITHGMLVLTIATGQANQLGLFEGTTLALLGMDRIRRTAPVRFGDTIHTVITVRETRESSKPGRHPRPGRGRPEPARRDGVRGRVDDPHGAAAVSGPAGSSRPAA